MHTRPILLLLAAALALATCVAIAIEWWPRAPLSTPLLPASQPKAQQRLLTPVIENWEQLPAKDMEAQAARFPGQVILSGPTSRRLIALSFDDGPSPFTNALLDMLAKHQVKATFFMMGRSVDMYREQAKRVLAEGHTIANHTYDHPDMSPLDGQPLATDYIWNEQVGRTQDIIHKILGVRPTLMRPPYGHISDDQVRLMQQHGMKVIQWSLDTQDWNRNRMLFGTHGIVRAMQDYAHEEAIVLMHDGGGNRAQTVEAVDRMIPWLKASGYRFVTVDQLLGLHDKYKPASTGDEVEAFALQ